MLGCQRTGVDGHAAHGGVKSSLDLNIMLRTIDLRGTRPSRTELLTLVPRAALDMPTALEQVQPLVDSVRRDGELALREQALTFDGVQDHAIRLPESIVSDSLRDCPADLRFALETLIERLRVASAAQVPDDRRTQLSSGATITQRWQPVNRVGLYAPGGKAAYPSSVLMNAIPAQAAGVRSLALASPAQRDNNGLPHQVVLWAAALAGITEVYAMGGAGAIAAFAFGVPALGLEAVDTVSGPGNIFVAAAKRAVSGHVGIDSEAGTTEILVIADEHANPDFVAADLVSQAEHDEAAASVLVTTSEQFAAAVAGRVSVRAELTEHSLRVREALSGPQSAVILVDDLVFAAEVSNAYGPEHLEVQTIDNDTVLSHIESAGAIFIGDHTPVSLGDYLAGSNHVLPTGGTARFSAGLGAHTFLRPQQIIEYQREALEPLVDPLLTLAHAEGLPAHGEAVSARFSDGLAPGEGER